MAEKKKAGEQPIEQQGAGTAPDANSQPDEQADATQSMTDQHAEQAAAQAAVNTEDGLPNSVPVREVAEVTSATAGTGEGTPVRTPATTVNRNGTVTAVLRERSWVGRPQEEIAATGPARTLAEEHGVDLNDVTPTGANGDILVEDVKQFLGIAEPKTEE